MRFAGRWSRQKRRTSRHVSLVALICGSSSICAADKFGLSNLLDNKGRDKEKEKEDASELRSVAELMKEQSATMTKALSSIERSVSSHSAIILSFISSLLAQLENLAKREDTRVRLPRLSLQLSVGLIAGAKI